MNLRKHYYPWDRELPVGERLFLQGYEKMEKHPLYGKLNGNIIMRAKHVYGKDSMAVVDRKGNIYVNTASQVSPDEWAYVLAHCLLSHNILKAILITHDLIIEFIQTHILLIIRTGEHFAYRFEKETTQPRKRI